MAKDKLLWDAIGEFGGSHELYEINYAGSHEEMRRYALFGTQAAGKVDELKASTERCLGEYDLQSWTVPISSTPARRPWSCQSRRRPCTTA